MSDKGIREFCQIALAKEFTTAERVKEVISDCIRAQKAGKEVPVGEIFMRKEYLDRKQVVEIMKELYGEGSVLESGPGEPSAEDPLPDPVPSPVPRAPAPAPAPAGRLVERPARPDPFRYLALAALFPLVFLAVLLALALDRAMAPEPSPATPSHPVAVLLATGLEGRIRIVGTEWADADGRGRSVLVVHYEIPTLQLDQLPAAVRVHVVHQGALVEALEVPFLMNADEVASLTNQIGRERLSSSVGTACRLVVPVSYPALADTILITMP